MDGLYGFPYEIQDPWARAPQEIPPWVLLGITEEEWRAMYDPTLSPLRPPSTPAEHLGSKANAMAALQRQITGLSPEDKMRMEANRLLTPKRHRMAWDSGGSLSGFGPSREEFVADEDAKMAQMLLDMAAKEELNKRVDEENQTLTDMKRRIAQAERGEPSGGWMWNSDDPEGALEVKPNVPAIVTEQSKYLLQSELNRREQIAGLAKYYMQALTKAQTDAANAMLDEEQRAIAQESIKGLSTALSDLQTQLKESNTRISELQKPQGVDTYGSRPDAKPTEEGGTKSENPLAAVEEKTGLGGGAAGTTTTSPADEGAAESGKQTVDGDFAQKMRKLIERLKGVPGYVSEGGYGEDLNQLMKDAFDGFSQLAENRGKEYEQLLRDFKVYIQQLRESGR